MALVYFMNRKNVYACPCTPHHRRGQSSLTASPPPPCLSQDLSRCKKVMEERGELFLEKISLSRTKVAKLCHTFIKDGAVSESWRQTF